MILSVLITAPFYPFLDRDRREAHVDYEVNLKAETEIRVILENLEAQNIAIAEIHKMLEEMRAGKTREITV